VSEIGYAEGYGPDHIARVRSSAETIVPLVMERLAPKSVVDLGCGIGTWLAVFARHGIADYLGVDGDWVPRELLEIPAARFVPAQLDKPFVLDRRFDLAVSLEVAEHLAESAAKVFVETTVRLASCVLFSAAIPHQGGLHHVNEQWQDYWAGLFAAHGYATIDAIRPRVWSDPDVAFWYKQNTLLFATSEVVAAHAELSRDREATVEALLPLVHPGLLTRVAAAPQEHGRRTAGELSLRDLGSVLPAAVARSLRWRVAGLRRRDR
jgi:SAM-dependent methyltransferase